MVKLKWTILPDGTKKLDVVPESPEKVEERKRLGKEERKIKNEGRKRWIKEKGFNNSYDYENDLAERKGYKDINEYRRDISWNAGRFVLPYWINENCPSYFGVCVAEKILQELFDDVKIMPYGFSGYDAVCKKEYKIDIKISCLVNYGISSDYWQFQIRYNKNTDYFLLFGFDDRKNKNILCSWLIGGNEVIKTQRMTKRLNERGKLTISNTKDGLYLFKMYELYDELMLKAREICKNFKKECEKDKD